MDEQTFHELLQRGARYNASDALFEVGQPPAFRVAGDLHYLQGERLRAYRVVELLDHIGTPEARKLLQTLAKGVAGATLTISAQAALKR